MHNMGRGKFPEKMLFIESRKCKAFSVVCIKRTDKEIIDRQHGATVHAHI